MSGAHRLPRLAGVRVSYEYQLAYYSRLALSALMSARPQLGSNPCSFPWSVSHPGNRTVARSLLPFLFPPSCPCMYSWGICGCLAAFQVA